MLSERVVAANLQIPHYTTQLMDRIAWATADAEAIESGRRGSRPEHASSGAPLVGRRESFEDRRASNATTLARLAASALLVLIAAVLSLA